MLNQIRLFSTARAGQRNERGFTLIEIMIVIAIIAAILAIGAPRLFKNATQMRSSVRKMAIATRELRNISRLYNVTNRLVININDEKGHTYFVESAPGTAAILTEEQQEELDKLTEAQKEDAPKTEWKQDTRVVKKSTQLPRGLFFESVEYAGNDRIVESGTAYVHFFPQGMSEEAAIHLTDRKTLNWTITIHPLTGRAEVHERKVMLKDLR